MTDEPRLLWKKLTHHHLIVGEFTPQTDDLRNWYTDAFQAISAWLAAIFGLGFFGFMLGDLIKSPLITGSLASLLIGAGYLTFRHSDSLLKTNLAFVFSLTGQFLAAVCFFGLYENNQDNEMTASMLLVEILLVSFISHSLHRTLSCLFAASLFCFLLLINDYQFLATGILLALVSYLILTEFHSPKSQKVKSALYSGLIPALLAAQIFIQADSSSTAANSSLRLSAELLNTAVLVGLVAVLLFNRSTAIKFWPKLAALVMTVFVSVLSYHANGLTVGVVLVLLGFSSGQRLIQGLGIVSMLLFLSWYYYDLESLLIDKAYTLGMLGCTLLIARWGILSLIDIDNESDTESKS
ncbi:DUF4401 domain-containing protein [Veronia pacifica]|uniref:DUF4401 domain-containing protein n=1 Tax=Veronia pacifica TaxID=1080227 RepID=A0A1C3ERK3_9GAMM|nr:DUF4401 domain-containing protein [Veronia pacifica]ODA35879.1 hypothetical protein A8L45_02265 [Veronia pacifica]